MGAEHVYQIGAGTWPPMTWDVRTTAGVLIDFSSGFSYSLTFMLASAPTTIVKTPSAPSVTGYATSPSVIWDPQLSDFAAGLTPDTNGTLYIARVVAVRASDSEYFRLVDTFTLLPAAT